MTELTISTEQWNKEEVKAAGLVNAAHLQALVVANADDKHKPQALHAFCSDVAFARGYLCALRKIKPGDEQLQALFEKLNHCWTVALTGPDRHQLRMVR